MKSFVATVPQKIVFGAGKINVLHKQVRGLGKKAAIITGNSQRQEKRQLIENIAGQLQSVGVDSFVFDGVQPNPTTNNCDMAAAFIVQNDCDFVIGVGGGSSMDAAKFAAMIAVNDGKTADYILDGKYSKKRDHELSCLPIVLISTTAGTGSECTPFAVVIDTKSNLKPGVGHRFWYPKVSIVDPELTCTLPKDVTINCGLDVFFHGMEAYVCTLASEYTDMYSLKAMQLVIDNLETCVKKPKDIEARSAMCLANSLAGTAIALSSTIAIHGMAHALGGQYDVPHGLALSSVAVETIRLICKGDEVKFAKVCVMLGADPSLNKTQLCEKCADFLAEFLQKFDRNIGCESLGAKQTDIERLADDTMTAMGGVMNLSPVPVTRKDVVNIFKKSM